MRVSMKEAVPRLFRSIRGLALLAGVVGAACQGHPPAIEEQGQSEKAIVDLSRCLSGYDNLWSTQYERLRERLFESLPQEVQDAASERSRLLLHLQVLPTGSQLYQSKLERIGEIDSVLSKHSRWGAYVASYAALVQQATDQARRRIQILSAEEGIGITVINSPMVDPHSGELRKPQETSTDAPPHNRDLTDRLITELIAHDREK